MSMCRVFSYVVGRGYLLEIFISFFPLLFCSILILFPVEVNISIQEIPGVAGKFGLWVQNGSMAKANRILLKNTVVIAHILFQQHKRGLYTWVSPDGQYQNQIDYILCSQRWRSSIESAKTRPGADCGSHHELHIAEFRLKLEKVGETLLYCLWGFSKMLK